MRMTSGRPPAGKPAGGRLLAALMMNCLEIILAARGTTVSAAAESATCYANSSETNLLAVRTFRRKGKVGQVRFDTESNWFPVQFFCEGYQVFHVCLKSLSSGRQF
jgi:hypothetical protein